MKARVLANLTTLCKQNGGDLRDLLFAFNIGKLAGSIETLEKQTEEYVNRK